MATKKKASTKTKTRSRLGQSEPPKWTIGQPTQSAQAVHVMWGEGYTQHPGWGLTADAIRGAYVLAEQGLPYQQCDIFEDRREWDGHMRSQFEGRIEAVTGKPWIVQAGGPDAGDVDAAKLLERALRVTNWEECVVEHLLGGSLMDGYAAAEVYWDRVDNLNVPIWFGTVPARRFRFVVETDEPRLLTREEPVAGIPLDPGKWVFAKRNHRKTVRAGLMRTALWWSWMKSLSMRDWQIFSSRFGLPFVLGKYDLMSNEAEAEKLALREAVLAFGKNGGAVVSRNAEIEVIESKTGGGNNESVHPGFVALCNAEISKLIQGATLTSGEGSSAGSYALGAVHANAKFDRTIADAAKVGTWVATQLGEAFIRYNGITARAPRVKVRVTPEMNPTDRMNVYAAFCNQLGGEVDEDQVRDEMDIRAPTGKALKGAPQPTPVPGGPPKPPPTK